jgi:LacI family transcriptional regulator
MSQTTTLKKISEALGISISTVSRALKHHPDISIKTRKKVIELAEALEYEPDINAVQLRKGNRQLLGLLAPAANNLFYESFISAVEDSARKAGYAVMILQSDNNLEQETNCLKLFRQNRVSGVLACITPTTTDFAPFRKLEEQNIPVVFYDKVPDDLAYHKVCLADAKAATLAADVILKAGSRHVLAIFGDTHLSITQKRLDAFRESLENGNQQTKLVIKHATNTQEAYALTLNYLKRKTEQADTLFCMSDEILAGSMKAVQESGLRYPKDIRIIGISNGFIPSIFSPEITYVETSGRALGELAVDHIINCIHQAQVPLSLTTDVRLVKGGSI